MKKETKPITINSVEDIIERIDTSIQYLDWTDMGSLRTISENQTQEFRDFLIALKDYLLGGER